MQIGIGFFVTVLVLAVLLGVVARFALAGHQDMLDRIQKNEDLSSGQPSLPQNEVTEETSKSNPHFHAL